MGGEPKDWGRGRWWGEPIETVFEDRVDMAVGAGVDAAGARARRLEPGGAVALGEPQEAETGAIALLGVRPVGENRLDEGGGLCADRARPGDDARGRPLEVALMGLRHMGRLGGVPAAHDAAEMSGHALAAMEEFDGSRGKAGVDEVVDEGIGAE